MLEPKLIDEIQELDENPRRLSDALDPRTNSVTLTARPDLITNLLVERRFLRSGWHTYFARKGDKFFYLEDLPRAMSIFSVSSMRFLKERGYIDEARKTDLLKDDGIFNRQCGIKLSGQLSPTRIGEAHAGEPVHFHVAVTIAVALELAIQKEMPDLSPYWPYEYLRIRPAVYLIRQFNAPKLRELREKFPAFDNLAVGKTHQETSQFLDDLAAGKPVTYRTAKLLKDFIDRKTQNDERLKVQGIVYELPTGKDKPSEANRYEIV